MDAPYVPPHLRNKRVASDISEAENSMISRRGPEIRTRPCAKEKQVVPPKELTTEDFPSLSKCKKTSTSQQCKHSWSDVIQRTIEEERKKEQEKQKILEKERIEQMKKHEEEEKKRSDLERERQRCNMLMPVIHSFRKDEDEDEDEDAMRNYLEDEDYTEHQLPDAYNDAYDESSEDVDMIQ